ncbi:MAG TPA: YbaK/EbsC family protein [Streptosporangiaceae bacterium]|jgi:prolyl-tRNA editing enzyme YbaK/EbsC (Cys-tRNA(Pro) deacylase)
MKLDLSPALSRPELLAKPVAAALADWPVGADAEVAPIDPDLADTAAFCEHYEVALAESANCVVVAGKRGGVTSYAACLVTAVTRADVNGVVRRRLDARKATFAPLDDVVAATGMEYGGITPVGLPAEWPIFIDARVVEQAHVVIGSGIRGSKLWLPGPSLATLAGAEVVEGLANPIS